MIEDKITAAIAAGGVSEYIDSVRKITNSGSGLLGKKVPKFLDKLHHKGII